MILQVYLDVDGEFKGKLQETPSKGNGMGSLWEGHIMRGSRMEWFLFIFSWEKDRARSAYDIYEK